MEIIRPKVTFNKADIECIENLKYLCEEFSLNPWEIIVCVQDRSGIDNIEFEFKEN